MQELQLSEDTIDVGKLKQEQYEVEINTISNRLLVPYINYALNKNNVKVFHAQNDRFHRVDRFPKMILPTDADLSGKTLPDKLDIQKELNIGKTNNSSTKKASDNKTTDAKDKTNVSQDDAPAVRAVDIVKKKPIDAPK